MLKSHRSELFLFVGAIAFAFNGVISKLVLEAGLSAWRLTEIRTTGAFVVMAAFVVARKPKSLLTTKGELPSLLAFGIIGIAAVQAFYFIGIARLNVSVSLLIEFTAPIWIVLWLRFVRKKQVSPLMWWGLSLGFTGLMLVAQIWKGMTLNGIGVIAAFLDAFALAGYFLIGEKLGKTKASDVMMVWGLGVGSLLFALVQPWWSFPFSFLTKQINLQGRYAHQSLPGWTLILWVVLLGTVLPYFCVISGLKGLSASTSSMIGMLEPILAGGFAWWWLNEAFNGIQLVGAVVVLTGIYFADRAKSTS
ncbi:MAG: EamA family transporter [Actinomycetes bacterium]